MSHYGRAVLADCEAVRAETYSSTETLSQHEGCFCSCSRYFDDIMHGASGERGRTYWLSEQNTAEARVPRLRCSFPVSS